MINLIYGILDETIYDRKKHIRFQNQDDLLRFILDDKHYLEFPQLSYHGYNAELGSYLYII